MTRAEQELAADPTKGRRAQVTVAVNLKLYFDADRTLEWSRALAVEVGGHPAVTERRVRLVVLPSTLLVDRVVRVFAGTAVEVGAQDVFHEDRGPFTGAVSGADLRRLGGTHVVVGHAERRRLFGEDDRVVSLKVRAAWRNALTPILCVGEDVALAAGDAAAACCRQLEAALGNVGSGSSRRSLVVAYEPVWAIGGDEPADAEHISTVTRALREYLARRPALAASPVIYGGSAQAGLLPALGGAADGLFLGRFAHDVGAVRTVLDEMIQVR